MTTKKYYYAVGRRKTSTATAHLTKGKWNILVKSANVNDYVKIEDYFAGEGSQDLLKDALFPFLVLWSNVRKLFDITLHVKGGGLRWQAEAIRLAIARVLVEFNPDYRPTLKPYGLLKRDPREKERKKPGKKKARKSPQWSKR
jgi:small subunit ribosomal protein S9